MKQFAATLMRHRDGILAWFGSRIANGIIEGINSLLQAAKAKARGYRTLKDFVAITYLVAGKLDLKATHLKKLRAIFYLYRAISDLLLSCYHLDIEINSQFLVFTTAKQARQSPKQP